MRRSSSQANAAPEKSPSLLAETYPSVAALVEDGGWIEMGYEYNAKTYARALNEGGLIWEGGTKNMTLEELLIALEEGIKAYDLELE